MCSIKKEEPGCSVGRGQRCCMSLCTLVEKVWIQVWVERCLWLKLNNAHDWKCETVCVCVCLRVRVPCDSRWSNNTRATSSAALNLVESSENEESGIRSERAVCPFPCMSHGRSMSLWNTGRPVKPRLTIGQETRAFSADRPPAELKPSQFFRSLDLERISRVILKYQPAAKYNILSQIVLLTQSLGAVRHTDDARLIDNLKLSSHVLGNNRKENTRKQFFLQYQIH